MKKKKKVNALVVALAVCAALLAVYFIVNASLGGRGRSGEQTGEEAIIAASFADPVGLRYRFGDYEYAFKKSGGRWICEQYPDDPIIQDRVTDILELLRSFEATAMLEKYGSLYPYGLDGSDEFIEVTDGDGSVTRIIIGDELPLGEELYLKDDMLVSVYYMYNTATDKVFTAYAAVIELGSFTPEELVELKVPDGFANSQVERFSLEYGGSLYELVPLGGDGGFGWSCTKDGAPYQADDAHIAGALKMIHFFYPLSCANRAADDAAKTRAGIDAPFARVELTMKDGGVRRYAFGDEVKDEKEPEKNRRYFIYNDGGQLTLCYSKNVSDFIYWVTGEAVGDEISADEAPQQADGGQ